MVDERDRGGHTLAFNPACNDYYQYCWQPLTQGVMGIPSEAVNRSRIAALLKLGKIHLSAWCQQQGSAYEHRVVTLRQLRSSWWSPVLPHWLCWGQLCRQSRPQQQRKQGCICCWHCHPPTNNCTPNPARLSNGKTGYVGPVIFPPSHPPSSSQSIQCILWLLSLLKSGSRCLWFEHKVGLNRRQIKMNLKLEVCCSSWIIAGFLMQLAFSPQMKLLWS